MTSFSAIWKDAGVLPGPPPLLVVPWEGVSLVYLNGVRGHDVRHGLKFDRSKLKVDVVSPSTVTNRLMTFAHNFPRSLFADVIALSGGVRNAMQFGSTLLSVTGNVPGHTASLDYVSKSGTTRMDVYTTERQTADIAFRFVRYLDAAGALTAGTKHAPAYAEELMAVMNRLYMPSANIELTLKSASAIDVQRKLGSEITTHTFREHIIPLRDPDADMTVFFVGKYKGDTDPLGQAWHDVNCIVVDDAPWQYIAPVRGWPMPTISDEEIYYDSLNRPRSDRDLHIVLAHEIAHLLGAGHNGEADNIMSTGRQDLRLSKTTVKAIGSK